MILKFQVGLNAICYVLCFKDYALVQARTHLDLAKWHRMSINVFPK